MVDKCIAPKIIAPILKHAVLKSSSKPIPLLKLPITVGLYNSESGKIWKAIVGNSITIKC